MSHFPVFLKADQHHALVVGSTSAALAKAALLLESGISITLIDPMAMAGAVRAGLEEKPGLTIADRTIHDRDMDNATLVYISTTDPLVERRTLKKAKSLGLPVNVVDQPQKSNFITGSIIRRGDMLVAISSGGSAPVFVRRLRAQLEKALSPGLALLSKGAGRMRHRVKTLVPDSQMRRQFWETLFDQADQMAGKSDGQVDGFIQELAQKNRKSQKGFVQLVGAGPGDPDLLTLKAHRALQQADVILFDRLVSDEVLSLARRDADRIYVGKKEGEHGIGQDKIQNLMISLAESGKRIVRLKSGDPMIFGRAGEELEALRDAGIDTEVIPGITALSGSAARAQIPITDRDFAANLSLVTAHTKSGSYGEYARLAGEGRTLGIYMGVKSAAKLSNGLICEGVSPETPVAIIENATRPDERRLYSHLSNLAETVQRETVKSPALFIIGHVVTKGADWPAFIAQINATNNTHDIQVAAG